MALLDDVRAPYRQSRGTCLAMVTAPALYTPHYFARFKALFCGRLPRVTLLRGTCLAAVTSNTELFFHSGTGKLCLAGAHLDLEPLLAWQPLLLAK